MSAMKDVVPLYPLTPNQLAEAVKNAGYEGYTSGDFWSAKCEQIGVRVASGQAFACYAFNYFDDNESKLAVGRIYVVVMPDGKLIAEW